MLSMNNEEIIQSFLKSSRELLEGNRNDRLRSVLLDEFGPLEYAFIADWIPEQGEDIYTVIVPPDSVVIVELSRIDPDEEPLVKRLPYREWKRGKRLGRKTDVLDKWIHKTTKANEF